MLFGFSAAAQQAPPPAMQNPSPMVDATRAHQRIAQIELPGNRQKLSLGTLFLPRGLRTTGDMPLVVHFHGAAWLAERSAVKARGKVAVLSVHLGAGSGVYRQAFSDPQRFRQLLDEAAHAINPEHPPRFRPLVITSFSAGYGAVRELLRDPPTRDAIAGIVLADGLHTSYVPEGTPGPLDTAPLAPFVDFARDAVAGRKCMVVTHSEIFPGTFASTTETADFLLRELSLRRRAVLRWGALGMQQLSEARAGRFRLLGFAGNTAPDHIDQFHALDQWLRQCR
jgi:hypothetical protein